jgi:subtilase family serine protease
VRRTLILVLCALPLFGQRVPAHAEDIGLADPSLLIETATLHLQPSEAQGVELQHLLAAQQDPASPDFHRWLTPEQFADRFGLSTGDLAKVSDWLRGQGFRIDSTARGRLWVTFSGTAGQFESAFGLRMHRYRLNGRIHYANANEPVVPAAVKNLVAGLRGTDNFPIKSPVKPLFTATNGHFLVPDDIATIYNTASLVKAGINGNGIKIGIPGGSKIDVADIASFRAKYNLAPSDP